MSGDEYQAEYDVPAAEPIAVSGLKFSASIGKLSASLAKAQGQFEAVLKQAENPYFKSEYADLATVIKATRRALSDNGIALVQSPQVDDSRKLVIITTLLAHDSGEWMSGELAIPVGAKWDAQTVGSAVSYGRRYALQSFLSVAGQDDDGNEATGRAAEDRRSKGTDGPEKGGRTINPVQQRGFWSAVKNGGKTKEHVAEYFKTLKIAGTDEMLKTDLEAAIKWAMSNPDLTQPLEESLAHVQDMKRIFAAAGKKQVPEDDVKRYAYESFNISSMKDMSHQQAGEVVKWIESTEA